MGYFVDTVYARSVGRKTVSLIVLGIAWVATAAASHEEGDAADIVVTLSAEQFIVFVLAPLVIVTALTYKLVHPFLVDRYAGDSVIEADPSDIRKYSIPISAVAGVSGAIAGMSAIHAIDLILFAVIAAVGAAGTVFLYRDVLQERAGVTM